MKKPAIDRIEVEIQHDRYRALLARVRELRHVMIIQREAVGLRRQEEVDRQYPIPPAPASSGDTRGEERR